MRTLILFTVALALTACAKSKTCEQVVENRAMVQNLTQSTQTVEFVTGDSGREVRKSFTLAAGAAQDILLSKGTSIRKPEVALSGQSAGEPKCGSLPETHLVFAWVSERSFDQVKVCWQLAGAPLTSIVNKNELCPVGSTEQREPNVRGGN